MTATPTAPAPAPVEPHKGRYVIGRNGVFATHYDRLENRLVVNNATEKHCRQVRDQLMRDQSAIDRGEGLLAEQKHQYYDLDPDSTCRPGPQFTCPNYQPKAPHEH